MRKFKNIFLSSLFIIPLLSSLFLNVNKDYVEAKADPLNKLGEATITEMEVYHPFGNTNEFFLFKLEGTDYPIGNKETIYQNANWAGASNNLFTFDFDLTNTIYLYDLEGKRINVTNFFEVYVDPTGIDGKLTFSIFLEGAQGAKRMVISKDFKIPSYAYLSGNTSSENYGYYTLNREYKAIARDINYVATPAGRYYWDVEEENYDKTKAYISNIFTYVDNENEYLNFNLFGQDIDYPSTGNHSLDVSNLSGFYESFRQHLFLYDENKNEIDYCFVGSATINPRGEANVFSIGIDKLSQAKYLKIFEELRIPSYSFFTNAITSELYNGFLIANYLSLSIDGNTEHISGNKIDWTEYVNIIKELTLASVETQKPFTNENEFFALTFNEQTDFSSIQQIKWDSSCYSLLRNLKTHYHLYDSNGNELSNTVVHDVYYNWHAAGIKSNSISIMTDLAGRAIRAVLNAGLLIPSYALYSGDKTSENYGYYSLKIDYEPTIEPGHTYHVQNEKIDWDIPSCSFEYYDENDNLITSLTEKASLGSVYTLQAIPEKEGFIGKWEIASPSDVEIVDNKIDVPVTSQTIKIKATYIVTPVCQIRYFDEDGKEIEDLNETVNGGSTYLVQPLISKKGYNASWVVVEPSDLEIVNNKIELPFDSITVSLQISYSVRAFTISFEDDLAEPIQVTFGEPIGELPEIGKVIGKVGHWEIDGEKITAETPYLYNESKTATVAYEDKICVITLETNGGNELEDLEILFGNNIGRLPTPEKEGYFFDYWSLDSEGNTPIDNKYEVSDDMILYAVWRIKCVIIFDTDGGSLIDDIIVGYGQKIEKPTTPTKIGYKFVRWTLNGEAFDFGSEVTSNITLKAEWEKIEDAVPDQPASKGGCGGEIVTTSLLLSLISLGGVILLSLKRKFE